MKVISFLMVVLLGLAHVTQASCPAYTCPDETCASTLAACSCTANAVLQIPDASFDRSMSLWSASQPVTGLAYTSYAVPSGNCSNFDFSPFVQFQWSLLNATNSAVIFQSNGSALFLPANTMRPTMSYTIVLVAKGLLATQVTTKEASFTVATTAPIVDITAGGMERRVSNKRPFVVRATVQDEFPGPNPSYEWACSPSASCPSLVNASLASLTIPADGPVGEFEITYTYRGQSSRLALLIVADDIPIVTAIQTSAPVVSVPTVYLSTQTIILGSSVQYAGNITYMWVLRGNVSGNSTGDRELGRGRSISIDANTLTTSLADGTILENHIALFVADSSNFTLFGSATISVIVLPIYDLSVTVKKSGDDSATEATALSDKLDLTTTSTTLSEQGGNMPFGLFYQMNFAYLAGNSFQPLNAIPLVSYVAVAPIPSGNESTTLVTFQAQLRIGGEIAAVANATFHIIRPNANEAAADQINNAASITDPLAAIAATANIQALMETADASVKAKLGSAALTMLTNSITSFDSQTGEQQKAIFDMCFSAVDAQDDPVARAALEEKTLNLLKLALSSRSFDVNNGFTALKALATVPESKSAATIALLASKLANDPNLPLGSTRSFQVAGVNISVVRESASDIGGMTTSSGASSFAFPNGFSLPGVDPSSVIGVSSASFKKNPFDGAPQGAVVSYSLSNNGEDHEVSGLTTAIVIKIEGATGASSCRYWDVTNRVWSSTGVSTAVVGGETECRTLHLTSFATFASSASAVATILPLFVAFLGVAFQLLVIG